MKIREKIYQAIRSQYSNPLKAEDLAKFLGISRGDYPMFLSVIKDLENENLILETKKGKLVASEDYSVYLGVLQGSGQDFSYFIPDDKKVKDIYIAPNKLNGAIHKDRVLVKKIKEATNEKSPEGEVLKVVERGRDKLVGTFQENKKFGFVILDDKKYGFDVFVPAGNVNGARNKDKVLVKLLKVPAKGKKHPEGVITEVIGHKDDPGIDIYSIAKQYNFPYKFPKKVIEQVDKIPDDLTNKDRKNRIDFRDLFTVTIDGADAKDFDDAISIEKDGDEYILYVHIADVTHYVEKGSALDKEAYNRGTSIYLLDRVVPMLPKKLSNGLCSLNPNVDRLAVTVRMQIGKTGKVKDYKFYESIINSNYRLVYDDVSDYLEGKNNIYTDGFLTEKLDIMKDLQALRKKKRQERGSIDFDIAETQVVLDENSRAIDVKKADRRIANEIIEEFMLICNETVAGHFGFMDYPFIYRVHDKPDQEKVAVFRNILANFGYHFKGSTLHAKDYQNLLEDIKGKPEAAMISSLLLRSMQKAKYSEEPGIHFGLAAMFYTHFTSPIRRYPDLFIHRIVKDFINHRESTNNEAVFRDYIAKVAENCSNTERRAEQAEREVVDMKCAEYMEDHVGEIFDGLVSGLTNFGIFVELDNTIEGLVQFQSMIDDYYVFDPDKYVVYGERSKRRYMVGQSVRVKVVNSDKDKREIDFELVEDER
ncbi:MAG: ribonuclease R [Finegoldia sp.]|nr:ribonuclease R [Finegoldia sp.]